MVDKNAKYSYQFLNDLPILLNSLCMLYMYAYIKISFILFVRELFQLSCKPHIWFNVSF